MSSDPWVLFLAVIACQTVLSGLAIAALGARNRRHQQRIQEELTQIWRAVGGEPTRADGARIDALARKEREHARSHDGR